VRVIGDEIKTVERDGSEFSFHTQNGSCGRAKKILLATGLADDLPRVPGLDEYYGRSVHHCLYCDGYEYTDQPVAALGSGEKGAALALTMSHWSADVILCTNGGAAPSAQLQSRLERRHIRTMVAPIAKLEGTNGNLSSMF
jgi:thioredoxin reductase